MKALLDTHALVWWLADDPRLSTRARGLIGSAEISVHVSAVSAWEIATKIRAGRFDVDTGKLRELPSLLPRTGFIALPVTIAHGHRAGHLPGDHRDPFDRILAAQSLIEAMPLVSIDGVLDGFGIERIW